MKLLEQNTTARKAIKEMGTAEQWANTFPRMRKDFDAIANLREMYRRMELNEAQAKRSSAGLGRRVAHLPPPVFLFLSIKFPEVLRSTTLLRTFLRANPHLLIVEKL